MSATADVALGVRLSDPKPGNCSACYAGADADTRFVDMDADCDRGSLVLEDGVTVVGTLDDLHLCEACVRRAAEAIGFKPELHARQAQKIRELELRVEHWKAYAKRQEDTLKHRPEIEVARRRAGR